MIRQLFFLIWGVIFFISSTVNAEVKIYENAEQYLIGNFDDPKIAQIRAEEKAQQVIHNKAMSFLKNYVQLMKIRLSDEEISAILSKILRFDEVNIEKIAIVHEGEPKIVYNCNARATLDTDDVFYFVEVEDGKINVKKNDRDFNELQTTDNGHLLFLKEKYNLSKNQDEKEKLKNQMTKDNIIALAKHKLKAGQTLAHLKNYSGALNFFNETIELHPNWYAPYVERGEVYFFGFQSFDKALMDFNKALEDRPYIIRTFIYRATIYGFDPKTYGKALADFDKAIELSLKSPELYKKYLVNAYSGRAIIFYAQNDYKKCFDDLSKSLQFEPDNSSLANILYFRGLCYQQFGENDKAQADISKARKLGFNN